MHIRIYFMLILSFLRKSLDREIGGGILRGFFYACSALQSPFAYCEKNAANGSPAIELLLLKVASSLKQLMGELKLSSMTKVSVNYGHATSRYLSHD